MSAGFSVKATLANVENFRRQIALMNTHTRDRTIAAIKRGTKSVQIGAEARAPKKSGELASTIRSEFSKNGLTGYVKAGFGKLLRRSRAGTEKGMARAKARRENNRLQLALAGTSRQAMSVIDLGVYAPVVERGDPKRHHKPHPFMIPAFNAERGAIASDVTTALRRTVAETESKL